MDNFEHYIRQKLQNYETQPSAQLWYKIQKRLKPWYKRPITKIAAIGLTTIVLIAALLLQVKNNKISEDTILSPKYIDTQSVIRSSSFQEQISQTISQPETTTINTGYQISQPKVKDQNKLRPKYKQIHTPQPQTPKTTEPYQLQAPKVIISAPIADKELNLDVQVSPKTGCEPLEVNFSVVAPKTMGIVWVIDKEKVFKQSRFSYTFEAGMHFVQLVVFDTANTFTYYDTIEVLPKPKAHFEADKCYTGEKLTVRNLSVNADKFIWYFSDGTVDTCQVPEHIFTTAGIYQLTLIAEKGGCKDTAVETIVVSEGEKNILFPNAFIPDPSGPSGGYYNPNDRSNNHIFHPIVKKPVVRYRLRIYDRSGRLIFESREINRGWDGYYRGKLVPIGVYIYVAEGEFEDGQKFFEKGDVTVIYGW